MQGVTVSADLPGIVDRIAFESGPGRARRRRARRARHAAGAGAAGGRRGAARSGARQLRAHAGPARTSGSSRAPSSIARAPSSGRPTRASARSARRSSARRSARRSPASSASARSTSDSTSSAGDALVHAAVAQSDLRELRRAAAGDRPGAGRAAPCASRADEPGGVEFAGRITAIDSVVDEATRNIQVQATLANPDGKLRPGMFVQAEVVARRAERGRSSLPASAISYAPYGDSVFVVADLKDPNGQDLSRRAAAVRQARRRARRSDRGPRPASSPATRS